MIRIAISSFVACAVLIVTLVTTWSRPELVIEIPHDVSSDHVYTARFTGHVPRFPDEPGYETSTAVALNWLIIKIEGVAQRGREKETSHSYYFVDTRNGNIKGPWTATLAMPHHTTSNERIDHRGRFVVDVGNVAPRYFFRVDLNSLESQRLVYPEGGNIIGSVLTAANSRLVLFRGGWEESIQISLIDLEDMTLIHEFKIPERMGFMDSWRSQVAAGSYDISSNGRFIALGESWFQEHRLNDPGVAIWNLETGQLVSTIKIESSEPNQNTNDSIASERPRAIAANTRSFPVTSTQQGYTGIKFSRCGNYVRCGRSRRVKHGESADWQMESDATVAFNVSTGNSVSLKTGFPFAGPIDPSDQFVQSISADGKRVLWASGIQEISRNAKLVDENNRDVSDWKTIPAKLISLQSLDAVAVPGTNAIAIKEQPFLLTTNHEQLWWAVAPDSLRSWAPLPDQKSGWVISGANVAKAYDESIWLFDFDDQTHRLLRRSSKKYGTIGETVQCQKNTVAILFNSENKSRLEIWPVPLQRPQWYLAIALGVATFLVLNVTLHFGFRRRS